MCQSQKSVGDGYLPKKINTVQRCSDIVLNVQSYHENFQKPMFSETMITVLSNGFWKMLQLNQWLSPNRDNWIVIATLQNQEGMAFLQNSKA